MSLKSSVLSRSTKGGSVTDKDWDGLVESLVHVAPIIKHSFKSGKHALVVEVGTLSGRTTRGIMNVLHRLEVHANVATIDKEASSMAKWGVNAKRFKSNWVYTEFFHGDSVDVINRCFGKKAIAWAFVDGCHCAGCVTKDIEAIDARMLAGGHICFHDAGNQGELGMLVHERYHGDGVKRFYGVSEAIEASRFLKKYKLFRKVKPRQRPEGPTPIYGGLQVWEKTA